MLVSLDEITGESEKAVGMVVGIKYANVNERRA